MIFPRSSCRGNAAHKPWRRVGVSLLTGAWGLAGCVSPPSVPPNVVIPDAHNNGYVLAFDDRSETLASGGSEGGIRLWRLPDGKALTGWKAHSDSVQGLKFIDHDRELLSADYDDTLALWRRDGTLLRRITTPSHITSMAADETSGIIVTGHRDGHVRLWRLADFSLMKDLRLHHGSVRAVAYQATNRLLASSGTDGRVFYWRLGESPYLLPSPPTDARDLTFTPDGKVLLGSGWFKLFRWQLADDNLQTLPTAIHGIIKSISLSRDGRTLASIGNQTNSSVYLLNARTGAVLKRFQPHDLCGTYVLFSPDGRYLASTSDDASIHIWDLRHLLPEQTYYLQTP